MYPYANVNDPMEAVQLTDPIVTSLVVGTPVRRGFPTDRLLPTIGVDSWTFKYETYGLDHMQASDTERAMRAEIKHSDWASSTEVGKLRRFTHEVRKDQDEINGAAPSLRIRERSALQARIRVEMDIQRKLKALLVASGSYASGHVLNITSGNEWNDGTNGDSRTDIRTQAALIAAKTGLSISDLSVFLTGPSVDAALEDPTFIAARTYTSGGVGPTEQDLARYWGVKEVWSSNPTDLDASGDITSMYGDIAIIYFDGERPSDFDMSYGEYVWAAQFRYNRGFAVRPYYTDGNTTWHFPFQDYRSWYVINNTLAALITNTAA